MQCCWENLYGIHRLREGHGNTVIGVIFKGVFWPALCKKKPDFATFKQSFLEIFNLKNFIHKHILKEEYM